MRLFSELNRLFYLTDRPPRTDINKIFLFPTQPRSSLYLIRNQRYDRNMRFKRLDLRFLEIGVLRVIFTKRDPEFPGISDSWKLGYCVLYLLREILNFQESQVKSLETHFIGSHCLLGTQFPVRTPQTTNPEPIPHKMHQMVKFATHLYLIGLG
eukprot:sb/3473279/